MYMCMLLKGQRNKKHDLTILQTCEFKNSFVKSGKSLERLVVFRKCSI